mmetsp:Transcript_15971/g.38392  ORF Transcript_15971/g.38392 Transcript_15971/m.38392 type:complete len:202 (-) Transcript_15971:421-1026(-)
MVFESDSMIACTALTSPPAPERVATILPSLTSYTIAALPWPPVTMYSLSSPALADAMQSTPALALLLPRLTFFSLPSARSVSFASHFVASSLERLSLAMDFRPFVTIFHVAFMAARSDLGILVRSSDASSSISSFDLAFLAGASASSSSPSLPRFCGSSGTTTASPRAMATASPDKNSSSLPRASSLSLATRATTLTAASF